MGDFHEEDVKDRLQDAVQDFIQRVASEHDEIPSREVYRVAESGNEGREAVANPSRVFTEYRISADKDTPILRDASEWLYNSDNGFELNLSDEDGNDIENPDKDQVIPWYTNEILMFAGQVMDYSGDFIYSDEAFDAAFEDYFKPKYSDSNCYEVIVPLLNFHGPDTVIKLNPDIEIGRNENHNGKITHIEVSPLTRGEKSGIFTFESRAFSLGSTGMRGASRWSHKLKFECETDGVKHGGLENKVIDRVLTVLRLFKPETADMGSQGHYRRNPNWLDYREGITNIDSSTWSSRTPTLRGLGYELEEDDITEFRDFWRSYRHEIDSETGSDLSTAIRRFNQTYSKETDEDRLIDCVIAFEATLLNEITQHASYRFRLPLRAGLLLDEASDHNRQYIHQFFKRVYDARSNVVHTGGELQEQSVLSETLRPSEFAKKTRDFLRLAILQYVDNQSEGKNIRETNQEIDDAMKKAPFPLQEEN